MGGIGAVLDRETCFCSDFEQNGFQVSIGSNGTSAGAGTLTIRREAVAVVDSWGKQGWHIITNTETITVDAVTRNPRTSALASIAPDDDEESDE